MEINPIFHADHQVKRLALKEWLLIKDTGNFILFF